MTDRGIGERIKNRRKELKMSQDELAMKLGYKSRSSINKIELNARNLTQSKIKAFADALEVTPEYIMGWDDSKTMPLPSTKRIPLLGTIACGNPITAIETPSDYVDVPDFVSADFALVCKGDSMINARIHDGDIVYIRRQPQVENGEIAAVLVGDEATLKRVFYLESAIMLQAENPAFPPMMVTDDVMILGKATHFVSKVR